MLFFSFQKTSKVTTPPQQSAPNQKVDFDELVEIIKGTPHDSLSYIRATTKNMVAQGATWKAIKGAIDYHKKQLPYFLFSGHCEKHHNNKTLEYNGCIQVDIDFKFVGGNLRALQVKDDAKSIPYVKLACISPSGYGVKILVETSNTDKAKHKQAQDQVINAMSTELHIEVQYFDSLGASQPCYVPFDQSAYFEEEADVFEVVESRRDNITPTQSFNYSGSDWIGFCKAHAKGRGYELLPGQRHNFLYHFAACANLLGIDKEEVLSWVLTQEIDQDGDEIKDAYRRYPEKFGTWAYQLEANKRAEKQTIIRGKEGQKLTDLVKPDDIIGKNLIAPTGSGKTWLINLVKEMKILLVPTIALAKNVEREYNACRIGGNRTNQKHYNEAYESNFIVCTYKSFARLAKCVWIKRKEYNVFVDEAHNFSSSTSKNFQLDELTEVLQNAKEFKSVTTLTGTAIYQANEFLRALPSLKVEIPRRQKTGQIVEAEDTLYHTAASAMKSIDKGHFPIVLLDDKGSKLAKMQGYLKDYNIKFFNSDTKQDQDWNKVTSEGIINEGIQGIVTTSVLKEGNNIYNKYDFDIITTGRNHSAAIEQLSNRPRRAKSIHITIVRSTSRTQDDGLFCPEKCASLLKRTTESLCTELNDKNISTEQQLNLEAKARFAIQANPVRLVNGAYEIDDLLLSNFVFERQKTQENRNDELMRKNLGAYGVTFERTARSYLVPGEAEEDAAKLSAKERKEKDLSEYNEVLNQLEASNCPAHIADHKLKNEKQLTKAQKRAYQWYQKIEAAGAVDKHEIVKQLKECECKRGRFSRLQKQIAVWQLENDPTYMAQNRKLAILAKAIREEFKAGQTLTGKAIQAKIISVLQIDSTIRIEEFEGERATKAINVLRMFFEVEAVRTRIEGKRVRKFDVRDTKVGRFLNTNQKIVSHSEEEYDEYWLEPAPF